MDPERTYPFLRQLLSPFWRRHRKTMAVVIAAIAVMGQARSFAVATTMARWLGTRLDSAVNRFYRLLRNLRVDDTLLCSQLVHLVSRGPGRHVHIAIDWTEWHHDLRMLVAAVVSGKRALPVLAQAFDRTVWVRSQNSTENTFVRVLADALRRAGAAATILCDRGFRRVSWVALLQQLRLSFVIRLKDDVIVHLPDGRSLPLAQLPLRRGSKLDLGVVAIRSDRKVYARVVGYWAPSAAAPWWLVTSERAALSRVLALYDRRMTLEEQFRNLKGKRFGVKLFWTQFRDPAQLGRFMMLLAVALLIWWLNGIAAARRDPSLLFRHRTKGPRQSFVTIGLRIVTLEHHELSITPSRIESWLEPPTFRRLGRAYPGGK